MKGLYFQSILKSDSQLGAILPSTGHLAISEDMLGCHNWGGTTGAYRGDRRDAAKQPAMPRTAPITITGPQVSVELRLRNPNLK